MTEIIDFLTARLDEDEAVALGVSDGPRKPEVWVAKQWPAGRFPRDWAVDCPFGAVVVDGSFQAPAVHIARHDPARVLADVAAKRAIMELHSISSHPERWGDVRHHPDQDWPHTNYIGQLTGGTVYSCAICDQAVDDPSDGPLQRELPGCETLLNIAAVYADHPDYDESWRP